MFNEDRMAVSKLVLAFALVCSSVAWGAGDLVDGVAAVVNEKTILISDVKGASASMYLKLSKTYSGAELQTRYLAACRETLQALIEDYLILTTTERPDEAALKGLADSEIDRIVRDDFEGNRTAFLAGLAKQHATIEDVRQVLADRIVISIAKRNEIRGRVAVSPGAVTARYKANIDRYRISSRVKLRMIVLHRGGTEKDAKLKRETAVSLKKRIGEGADFASLARSFSEGVRAGRDGDWGWVEPKSLRPELATAVSKLKAGEVSPVVETKNGFYLLKVDGLKGESVTALAAVREDIERELRGEQSDRIFRSWIERLRKRSYVRILAFGPQTDR